MNAPLTTRAGEGFDRKAWTVTDLRVLVQAGVMDEDAPFDWRRTPSLTARPSAENYGLVEVHGMKA